MRAFEIIDADSFKNASELLRNNGKTDVMAGGTDLLNVYKQAILKDHPDKVVSLKRIPDSSSIKADKDTITVGAMTRLTEIAESPVIQEKAKALSDAAHSVATPLIRNLATIGGNICQDVRCWYYRYPNEVGGRIDCSRKGGLTCYAVQGDNRYHSIYGGMKTHASACTKGCPAGTDVSAYMAKMREGDIDGAARIIMRANPLPMCTSRICPHPCQDDCNQSLYGECVGIHCVERTIGDYILEHSEKFYASPKTETGKKVGIIGAGPGGLACAYYLRSAGHDVTVIDAHEKAGGVLQYGIPRYRLPKDVVDRVIGAIEGMGVKFELGKAVGTDVSMDEITGRFDSPYFSTGAWKQPVLGIKGEELTQFGLDFLVEVNSFLKKTTGDNVLVCGGGNVAMDVALTAKRLGAKNVRLVCLESAREMPATAEEIERAKEEGVEICNGWGLKAVTTDADGKATGLMSMRCTSVFDEKHHFAPVYDENDTRLFDADAILLATGQRVDLDFLGEKFGPQLKSRRGLFEVNPETYQTASEKIYAGGDAVTGPNIAIRAIGAAGCAARAISRALGTPIESANDKTGFLHFDREGVKIPRNVKLPELPKEKRTLTDEDSASVSIESAINEAKRCMNCGCYSVNASDISPVLIALRGKIVTTKKIISATDFFTTELRSNDMLDPDEIVTAVKIPDMSGYVTGYNKIRIRTAIDFALVSLAYAYKVENGVLSDVHIVAGGVAPVPVELKDAEACVEGKTPSDELAHKAGKLAIRDTCAMSDNAYKITQLRVSVERLIASIH